MNAAFLSFRLFFSKTISSSPKWKYYKSTFYIFLLLETIRFPEFGKRRTAHEPGRASPRAGRNEHIMDRRILHRSRSSDVQRSERARFFGTRSNAVYFKRVATDRYLSDRVSRWKVFAGLAQLFTTPWQVNGGACYRVDQRVINRINIMRDTLKL